MVKDKKKQEMRKAIVAERAVRVEIPAPPWVETTLVLRGITDLIVHKWSEKALQEMRDKQQGKAKLKKEPKDPAQEFDACKYRNEGGEDCVLACALKKAIVAAARMTDEMTMVALRGAIFVKGERIPIMYDECVMREDPVRVGNGAADLRYRPAYKGWRIEVTLQFLPNIVTPEQLMHLVMLAGFSVGIHEWRPEKGGGDYGRFEIAGVKEAA